MKQTSLEFINAEMERRGDSGVKTARLLGMSQPGYLKAVQNAIPFRINNFVRYCNAAGYDVAIIPKAYSGMMGDSVTILSDAD